jgi:hypothetical protein
MNSRLIAQLAADFNETTNDFLLSCGIEDPFGLLAFPSLPVTFHGTGYLDESTYRQFLNDHDLLSDARAPSRAHYRLNAAPEERVYGRIVTYWGGDVLPPEKMAILRGWDQGLGELSTTSGQPREHSRPEIIIVTDQACHRSRRFLEMANRLKALRSQCDFLAIRLLSEKAFWAHYADQPETNDLFRQCWQLMALEGRVLGNESAKSDIIRFWINLALRGFWRDGDVKFSRSGTLVARLLQSVLKHPQFLPTFDLIAFPRNGSTESSTIALCRAFVRKYCSLYADAQTQSFHDYTEGDAGFIARDDVHAEPGPRLYSAAPFFRNLYLTHSTIVDELQEMFGSRVQSEVPVAFFQDNDGSWLRGPAFVHAVPARERTERARRLITNILYRVGIEGAVNKLDYTYWFLGDAELESAVDAILRQKRDIVVRETHVCGEKHRVYARRSSPTTDVTKEILRAHNCVRKNLFLWSLKRTDYRPYAYGTGLSREDRFRRASHYFRGALASDSPEVGPFRLDDVLNGLAAVDLRREADACEHFCRLGVHLVDLGFPVRHQDEQRLNSLLRECPEAPGVSDTCRQWLQRFHRVVVDQLRS